jgi:hypothetical protein
VSSVSNLSASYWQLILSAVVLIGTIVGGIRFFARHASWLGRDTKHRIPCLPPSSLSDANEAANQRRRFLDEFIGGEDPANFPRFEILERPPGIELSERPTGEFSPTDAIGQMVRLRWQIEQPELLLLERVVDAAIAIVNRAVDQSSQVRRTELLGAIRLEPRKRKPRDKFPWVVILETNHPEVFRSEFEILKNWLAIEILFDQPSEIFRYGQCQMLGGRLGEIGGLLEFSNQSFPMTCAHVLSHGCASLAIGTNPGQGQQPDAALIQSGTPCFHWQSQSASPKTPATRQDVERCMLRADTVRYANTRHKRVRGYLYGTVSEFPVDGVLYRFPHEMVVPITRLLFGFLPWPLRSGFFSEPGDSGSWILTEKSDRWVGMVVGGDPFTRTSYIAEGGSLLKFFELEFIRRGQAGSLNATAALALQ